MEGQQNIAAPNGDGDDNNVNTSSAAPAGTAKPVDEGNAQEGANQEKKYTDADLDEVVERRLARERKKIEREVREAYEANAAAKASEAKKLQDMSDLERARYEAKKAKEENERLTAQINLSEQMAVARRELAGAGISMGDELLSMFVSSKAEDTSKAIGKLKELWPQAVNDAVQEKLKRTPPAAEGGNPPQKSFGASYAESYSKKMNGGK